MGSPPTCGKCNTEHWRFNACPEGKQPAPIRISQPLPEGVRVWGDRLETLERRGESTFLNRREVLQTGRVVYPDGSTGPKQQTDKEG